METDKKMIGSLTSGGLEFEEDVDEGEVFDIIAFETPDEEGRIIGELQENEEEGKWIFLVTDSDFELTEENMEAITKRLKQRNSMKESW